MSDRTSDALIALRQIQRQIENSSKRLAQAVGLTPSQLLVMQLLTENGRWTASDLARAAQLSNATLTALIDKLVEKSLVGRRRSETDRRRVWLELTSQGERVLNHAPDPLHAVFSTNFQTLEPWAQAGLVAALERIVALLEAERLDAAPVLDFGALDKDAPHTL